jgi:hypothetical protein
MNEAFNNVNPSPVNPDREAPVVVAAADLTPPPGVITSSVVIREQTPEERSRRMDRGLPPPMLG